MSPALIAALAQGAIGLITYLDGLPEQQRAAEIAALEAARKGAISAVAKFDQDSAADLQSALAAFQTLTGHSLVQQQPGMAAALEAMGKQISDRVLAPIEAKPVVTL